MRILRRAVLAALVAVGFVMASGSMPRAQDAPTVSPRPQQSPTERALGQRLFVEINAGLQCGAGLISAHDEIAKLQKEIADLKAPKSLPPK